MDYYIKNHEWEHIFNILRKRRDVRTGNAKRLRIFIEALRYTVKTGCQWRMLPGYYGSWRAVHRRFKNWSDKGVFASLLAQSISMADMEWLMMDSTIIRAHPCSAGYKKDYQEEEGLGRSKGGFTTKIHALVDGLGNPLKFILTSGQRNDITQGEALTQGIKNTTIIADKGYDANALLQSLEAHNCLAVIPPKKNRKIQREYDKHIYKERHLIECFFNKIKHFRRIFSRFDKTASAFLSFLQFVSTFIWLR